jgi:hypothetical protein
MNSAIYNSKTKPVIVKSFEAWTGHITKEDNALLKREDCPLSIYHYEYGCFIYSGDLKGYDSRALKNYGFSSSFVSLMEITRGHSCKFLQLDCEGAEYEDLPKFSW